MSSHLKHETLFDAGLDLQQRLDLPDHFWNQVFAVHRKNKNKNKLDFLASEELKLENVENLLLLFVHFSSCLCENAEILSPITAEPNDFYHDIKEIFIRTVLID